MLSNIEFSSVQLVIAILTTTEFKLLCRKLKSIIWKTRLAY